LYVRRELWPKVWTTLASSGWDTDQNGMRRLMYYGCTNRSLLQGAEQAADLHLEFQPARVGGRIVGLADRLRAGLAGIRGVQVLSSTHPALISATTVYRVAGVAPLKLQDELWDRAKIRVRAQDDVGVVRQCCHIYNSEEEIERTLDAVRKLA